jgi:hypothetical protein
MTPEYLTEVVKIFKERGPFFKHKLICTFLMVDNKWVSHLTNMIMTFYTPVRPLFLLKEFPIPHEKVLDVLNNKPLLDVFIDA